MALNPDYIIAPNLNQYFVDKNTGLPMSAGKVKFFSDVNRSIPKAVFKLSGSPPNYSYIDIGSELPISGVGTLDDGLGNDIVPYYYPFDVDGNVELYFIEVYDSNDVFQYTREAWPNFFSAQSDDQKLDVTNYIPNGQFWAHNNIPADIINNRPAGQVPPNISSLIIAPGGWVFERPITSIAIDNISFQRRSSYVSDPPESPRYSLRLACTSPSPLDGYKVVGVKFQDVNKFASLTQPYTFTFTGVTDLSADTSVGIAYKKNYGTGGSPEINTSVTTVNITNVIQTFSIPIIFGDNTGQNIGSLNDDYLLIYLNLPTNMSFALLLDDFSLIIGDVEDVIFPIETTRDFLVRSVSVSTPDYNGYTLGLPIIQTKDGLSYDISNVGKVFSTIYPTAGFGELLCNGAMYRTDAYSSDGIPYKRLQTVLTRLPSVPPINYLMPIFGTGDDYVTASDLAAGVFCISNNTPSLEAVILDGALPTGFTFTQVSAGFASYSSLGLQCFTYGVTGNTFWALNVNAGLIPSSNINSGAGCPQISTNTSPNTGIGELVGTEVSQQMYNFTVGALPAASTFIQLSTTTGTIKAWFTVDGIGTLPAGTGTPVRINLLSSMALTDASYIIAQSLSGNAVWTVSVLSGSAITPNSYFTFISKNQKYYVWYNLNGTGTDPNISNAIGIPVIYSTSDIVGTIEIKTMSALNSVYFKVPDLRGLTIKGWSSDSSVDKNIGLRYSANSTRLEHPQFGFPAYIGSQQKDVLLSHSHSRSEGVGGGLIPVFSTTSVPFSAYDDTDDAYIYLQNTGTPQNDVKNVYLNFVIKY
jgi:hypothetical protein